MEIYTWPANDYRNYLAHHGILGMKWGIRRFQNPDGSLTPEGRERYGYGEGITKRLDPRLESSFNPHGLSDKEIEITNKYADAIIEDAEIHLLAKGFSEKAIEKERKKSSGVYADAIEASWEKYRDMGLFNGKLDSKIEKLESAAKDLMPFEGSFSKYYKDPVAKKRMDAAADLGLRALIKNGWDVGDGGPGNPWTREWFIFEDQTIGMGTIADAINQGMTSKEVKKLIKEVENNYDYDLSNGNILSNKASGFAFEVSNGNWNGMLEGFADTCFKIKKSDTLKEAKKTGEYNIDFLETVQNDAVLHKGGKDLLDEYSKFLDDPNGYMKNFKESSYQKRYKNTPEVREAMRIAKAEGWNALTAKQKELLNQLD